MSFQSSLQLSQKTETKHVVPESNRIEPSSLRIRSKFSAVGCVARRESFVCSRAEAGRAYRTQPSPTKLYAESVPHGRRVSMGSCEIPGVLTRAIYHARSVFAYVVKGPRRPPPSPLMPGTSRSRVPFEIRVFANTALPPLAYLSASLYSSALPRLPSPDSSPVTLTLLFTNVTQHSYRPIRLAERSHRSTIGPPITRLESR